MREYLSPNPLGCALTVGSFWHVKRGIQEVNTQAYTNQQSPSWWLFKAIWSGFLFRRTSSEINHRL